MSDMNFELSIYVGNMFTALIFGIQIYMCFHSCYLMKQGPPSEQRKNDFYIAYSVIMMVLSAFAFGSNAFMGQLMWINHRDYPGGPLAYYFAKNSVWFEVFGSTANILQNYMNDALMLYRCYIIWNGNLLLIILPVLMFLGSIALSILALVQSALPNSSFYTQAATNFAVPWISLTTGLNLIVTILIGGRIAFFSWKYGRVLSSANSPQTYTGIVAILVESALPVSVLGIILAVFLGKGQPAAIAFSDVWGILVAIAPQLIILRVAMGRAWMRNTASQFAASRPIAFAHDSAKTMLEEGIVGKNEKELDQSPESVPVNAP